MTPTKSNQYAEWAVRFIIAVIVVLISIGFQRQEKSNDKLNAKLDKMDFEKYCAKQDRIQENQQKTNEEVLKLLYEIKGELKK
jgi:hypothetical protein